MHNITKINRKIKLVLICLSHVNRGYVTLGPFFLLVSNCFFGMYTIEDANLTM